MIPIFNNYSLQDSECLSHALTCNSKIFLSGNILLIYENCNVPDNFDYSTTDFHNQHTQNVPHWIYTPDTRAPVPVDVLAVDFPVVLQNHLHQYTLIFVHHSVVIKKIYYF